MNDIIYICIQIYINIESVFRVCTMYKAKNISKFQWSADWLVNCTLTCTSTELCSEIKILQTKIELMSPIETYCQPL